MLIVATAQSAKVHAPAADVVYEALTSKRREAIKAAAEKHGYSSAKGLAQAALRTRQAKRAMPREHLFDAWKAEAQAMGFELKPAQRVPSQVRPIATNRMPTTRLSAATGKLASAARAIDHSAALPGVKVDLKQHKREAERSR